MSYDETDTLPFVGARGHGYRFLIHENSNRSFARREEIQRQRLIKMMEPRDFRAEPLITRTIIRGGTEKLPRQQSPTVARANRSKYQPHVGKKQIAKASRR
jgi:hypothetical protein